jgi:hypothetical protein
LASSGVHKRPADDVRSPWKHKRSLPSHRLSNWTICEFARDCKPQENEPGQHKQGLEDDVHIRVRNVMKTKNPMHKHDVEAQDEPSPRERA